MRIQNLGNSPVMLGQGVPFFHARQDILRSKSMDRDSCNSGDWLNAVDVEVTKELAGRKGTRNRDTRSGSNGLSH